MVTTRKSEQGPSLLDRVKPAPQLLGSRASCGPRPLRDDGCSLIISCQLSALLRPLAAPGKGAGVESLAVSHCKQELQSFTLK